MADGLDLANFSITLNNGDIGAKAGPDLPISNPNAINADVQRAQVRSIPGGNGIIYSLHSDGGLMWFKHLDWTGGTMNWANGGSGRLIGTDWQYLTTILASHDGQLFGFCGDGTIQWHQWVLSNPDTGEGGWAPNTSNVIAQNFDQYAAVFGGPDNVIYALDANGDLWWFKYLAGDGTSGPGTWANDGRGARIMSGLHRYNYWFADPKGIFYGVRHDTELHRYQYLAGDGSSGDGAWLNSGNPIKIGNGWDPDSTVERFSNGGGAFYCVWIDKMNPPDRDHELRWYFLANWDTITDPSNVAWIEGGGKLIGTGWTTDRTAALEGNANSWSVVPGQTINFSVSTTFAQYQASVVRLTGPLTNNAVDDPSVSQVVWGPQTFNGRYQDLPAGFRANGTGWTPDVAVPTQATWKSGFHILKLTGPRNMRRHIPFVVRPAVPTAKIALMMPFLTYNAYNEWAGHTQYSWEPGGQGRRQITHRRPFANVNIAPVGHNEVHAYQDLILINWLTKNNISFDMYQDMDLHNDPTWLTPANYKAIVLASHPEYFTPTMRDRLVNYINSGGRLIYTGGNGIYERVDITPDGNGSLHRDLNGNRWLWRDQGLAENQITGVAWNGDVWFSFDAYQVDSDHRFLAGTGLKPGDQFGGNGLNEGASGWETDIIIGPINGLQLIAHGLQGNGTGANMVYVDKGNGGWVFSASSLTFNGALPVDTQISQLMLNVFNAAVL